MSLPSRERGLKFDNGAFMPEFAHVAPLAGAWIEIADDGKPNNQTESRSPRGSVD